MCSEYILFDPGKITLCINPYMSASTVQYYVTIMNVILQNYRNHMCSNDLANQGAKYNGFAKGSLTIMLRLNSN